MSSRKRTRTGATKAAIQAGAAAGAAAVEAMEMGGGSGGAIYPMQRSGMMVVGRSPGQPAPLYGRYMGVGQYGSVPRNVRTSGYVGLELKFVDQVLADTTPSSSWVGGELDPAVANCLGACIQGTGESERNGLRIVVKSIHVQGMVYRSVAQDAADARAPNLIQLSLVMDKQTNAAQLNAEDVYVATDPEVPARRVVANSSRFKVLKTELFALNDVAMGTDGANTNTITGNLHHFDWFIKMNQVVNFVAGGGGGTVADFRDVSFHMIGCGFTGSDNVTYNSRVRFDDRN